MRPLRFPFIVLITLSARVAAASEESESDDFRQDVFACEEAVAHLTSCCAGLSATEVRCVYRRDVTGSCGYYTHHEEDPGITPREAECLLAIDCDGIRERGICERARDVQSRTSSWTDEHGSNRGETTTPRSEPLCR